MNDEYLKKLYAYIGSQDSEYHNRTTYDDFKSKMGSEDYSTKVHGYIKGIDSEFRSLEDFNSMIKKKSSNGGSTSAVGSLELQKPEDYTYGDSKSAYRKQGNQWLISNESTKGNYVAIKDPTGSRAKELEKNARKMSSLDIKSEQASKEISKTKDLSNVVEADSEIFTGYPGKEKNQYEFKDDNWYEPNPEVEKTIQRETEKRKSLVGTAYEKTIAINIKNAIKDIPKTRVIKDDARIKALNKQFGKNAVAPIASEVPLQKAQKTDEQDYFTGAFGDVLRGFDNIVPIGIGDFVDDMARSVASGYRQGTVAQEADDLLLKGSKSTPEQIQKFINANKNSQQMLPSAEMQDYQKIYEEEGKGFWGVVKGIVKNPSVIGELMTSSLVSMATNTDALKAGAAGVATGTTYGAVTGATAGGVGAIPGSVAGAISSIPYAFGLASSVVEMGATFGELLTEELKGKELTKENVKAILEDPKKLQSIRNKAIARGVIIGAADALTGKLASGVGAKIISKSAAKSATGAITKGAVVKSTAVGAAIEAAGGSAGEATARGAIGQDMDVSEIALEGIAELPGGIRSTIQARLAKPSYKVNGAKATSEQVDELINTMTPDDLAKTKIEIKNDYEGREFKIQDKIVTNSIKQQVKQGNPDLNEPSLNAITQLEKDLVKLEGNTTQTGKDKAAAIRTQIKNIQENQLQEEVTAEVITAETPEITKKRTERIAELETTLSQSKNNKGTITIDDKIIPRTELENELETLKIEQNAIQEQAAGQVPVQPTTAVGEEVVQGEPTTEPQVLTEKGKAEEVVPLTLEEELQIIADEKVIAPTLEAPVIEAPVVETPTLEAPTLEAPVVEAEATPKEKVVAYRAEEQAELLKAIPKIESYKVKGKIDKTKMPKTVLAKYNKIYDKYDALISPLLPAVKTKAPVVKAPVTKTEAPKAKGEPTPMRWDDVEEYDDAVIRAMKEIQYRKLKPLLDLGKRTTVAQKEEIIAIQAKIATAERILNRRADKIKKEAQRVEKAEPIEKGTRVRGANETEFSIVIDEKKGTAKVKLKKTKTFTPKSATTEANLTIQTDEKRGRFVETKNKTKVYIDEVITPAKVEPTKVKVTSKAKVKAEPIVEMSKEIEEAIAEERLFLESMIEDGAVGFDKDLKLLNSNPYKYADEKNKKFSKKDKNGKFLNPESRNKYLDFYLTLRGRAEAKAPVAEAKKEFIIDGKEYTEEEAIEIGQNNFRNPNYGSKMEYNGSNPQAKEFVNNYNRDSNPYNRNGVLKGGYMQEKLSEALGSMNFRKFGNLYRKHIDPYFSRESNEKSQGGQVSKNFSFRELAGYIIGDAIPSSFEEVSFRAFAKEAGIEIPAAPAKVETTKAKVTPATTSVKALFESNPELANEVYEALGIKDNVVTKTKKKIDFDKLDKKWSEKILNILKEKYPEVSFEFTEDAIQFIDDPMVFMQLSNKMYTEFKRLLTKKRPDLVDRGLIEKSLDDISAFSDEFGTKENKIKLEKLALHWMLNGAVILPEDGPKVVEAEKIASKKKLDAFSYSNPNEIIEKFAEESKKEKVDPDTLSSFTNKKEIGDGIVIYDVENSDKGQEQARIVLDTHFGEKSNPWCLLYKDADGSLTRAKEHWFGTYSGDKKIAFQNGKLIAFYGGGLWWDRLDNSSDGIPIVRKIKDDSLKRKQLIVVDSNDANKIISYGNKTLGNEQNGEYKEWDKNDNLRTEANFKDGQQDGKTIEYYSNGQIEMESNFKDGLANGKTILYYRNGKIQMESNFKNGEQEGKEIRYYKNGQIKYDENYKDGKVDGNGIGYYENGKLRFEANYKDGKRIDYYENGQIQYETDFKNGEVDGKRMSYYDNGQLESETNYKDDRLNGYQIQYRDNRTRFNLLTDLPQIEYERLWKDGKIVSEVNYQKNKEDEIIGQANTKAMTVLVNALKQKKDTIPHEYAHIYIAMFIDTPIVQEGIKRFGSEEKLVQAIGEQVVQQKGEAYNWWKKFTNFILKIMSDQQVVQVLTDSFLERADLTTYNYTKYSKAQAQNLFSDYIKQNPSGDIDGFREFVFEKQTKAPVKEASAPAKESTDDLMGAINSIKEDITNTTEEIEDARAEAREKVNKIREEILDLKESKGKEGTIMDLEADIKEIEDILKDDLDGLKLDLDRHVQALKEEVKKLEDLDAKNPENKKTLISYLDAAIKTLNGLNKLTYAKLDAGVTLGTLKLILQGIRAGVIAGNTIKASIKAMASQYRGKHKNKKITIAEFTKEIEEYLRNTFVDQKTNEQDIQEARDKFVEIREAVRKAKIAVKTESKTLRDNAFNAIRTMLKGKVKDLSSVQMKSIMLRLARFNVFSQTQYDKFIDYVDKVIGIADYDKKVNDANTNRKNAKKNLPKLGDISSDLLDPLSRVLNINAKLIPSDVFESYYEIVDMLSKRDAILELNKRADLNESLNKIIESIELNEQRVSDLKELYDNFADKVVEDKVVNYAKTLDKMLEDGVIDKTEHELMKTFKSKIQGAKVKEKMSEQEIADEKAELIDEINNTTITLNEIVGDEFRLERELAKRLQVLLKQTDFQNLNNKELKDLLRIIDNINNGFVFNATQQMVEKLNKIKDGVLLAAAIPKSLKGIFRKVANVRRKLTKDIFGKTIQSDEFGLDAFSAASMDEQLNNFKSTPIFDITREQSAIQIEKFKAKMTEIISELARAENEMASWSSFRRSGNKMQLSKFKMSIYMMQLEFNSNPNSNQVHQAMDTLNVTIKFAKRNKGTSTYSDLDIEQMEFIKEEFGKNGEIDIDKLYKSFNKQEKDALKIFKKINSEMTKFATYTATVINGKKIEPINNYFFYNTINENKTSAEQITDRINNINDNMNPTTVSKNLEERDGNVHAVQLNPFNAVNISARSVLLNYYMTEPIRTTKKTFAEARKIIGKNADEGIDVGKQFDILSVLENSYDTAFSDLVESYINESQAFFDYIKKTSYRAMLGSTTRALGEYLSNAYGAWVKYPKDMMEGKALQKIMQKEDSKNFLVNLDSKLISRLFAADNINSSGQVDLSNITNRITKNGKTRTRVVNGVTQVWDYTVVKWVDLVGTIADNLISKPDKSVLIPLWFGSFSRAFKKETGVDFDENKIKANDEEYMDKYRDALAKATKIADKNVNTIGGNMNSFMGVLQNSVRNDDNFLQASIKNFQQYMSKFIRQDYDSARKGLNALVGNGTISKTDGGILLGVILSRQMLYGYLVNTFAQLFAIAAAPTVEFIFSLLGFEDDDDDDKTIAENVDEYFEKGFTGELRKLYRTSLSAITTVLLGGNSGNALRVAENYFIEKANKKYGEKIGLRDEEYDPYKNAIQFNQFQGIKSKDEALVKTGKVLFPMYSPLIGVTEVGLKLLLSPEPKGERAKLTRAKEYVRLGLEAAGNAGVVPLYKDIKKIAHLEIYKELSKETKETAVKKEAEEIETATTNRQKISSLRKMRGSGRYTDKEINKAIRIIKDPEYKKAFNDKEEAIKKKILDKYGYDNKEDFERNDEKNYEIEFGKRSNYFQERAESARIANELEKRVNALEDGVEYAPRKKSRKSSRNSYTGTSGYTGNSYTN